MPTKTQKLDLALDDDDGKLSKSEEESSSDEPPDSDMDSATSRFAVCMRAKRAPKISTVNHCPPGENVNFQLKGGVKR